MDGSKLGWLVGFVDEEGESEGAEDGCADFDGVKLGSDDGSELGTSEGIEDGAEEG